MPWPAGIYWVDAPDRGRLAVVGRPRAGSNFAALKAAGIDVLVSLLEADEAADIGLADEAGLCEQAGMAFMALPVTDHGVPRSFEVVEEAAGELCRRLASGAGVGAHCYAGLGRSPLLVAAVLIHGGMAPDEATARVSVARGLEVPEMATQHQWLHAYHTRRLAARGS